MSNACLIANPAAGRGRGARRLPGVKAALEAVGIDDVRVTRSPGEERYLAAVAASQGIETIVASGGDGTWGNVARGIRESGRDARLVLHAAGTGNDFSHALKIPANDAAATARIAAGAAAVRVDMGRIDGVPFLNVAGAGLQTAVLRAMGRQGTLRGPLAYVATALPLLRTYAAMPMAVQVDEEEPGELRHCLAAVISNGSRFGGGFRVAPAASVTDGLLDVITVGDGSLTRRLSLFVRTRLGAHVGQDGVSYRQAGRLRLFFDEAPLLDVDGELHQASGCELEACVLPSAIRVGVVADG